MKKAAGILLAAALIVSGCGGEAPSNVGNQENSAHTSAAGGADTKSKDVQITLPAGMFEDQDMDQVIEQAKQEGVKEAVINEDGSVTYTMSKANHEEMLAELGQGIADYAEELLNDGTFPSVKDVSINETYSEYTLTVDQAAFENSMDAFVMMGLGIQGMMHQMMEGRQTDEQKVTVNVKDEGSGEIFNTVVYPEALQNQ
ncbi:hypothetical protein [Paenibacillus sp. 1P07SE]|uniref:hypothetical protein n=1 Tax=Paenibacillus sp. 1P07SE TaxID=3132209 RepID=UPI0039A65F3E